MVLGGGAAGLMCAIEAGKRGRSALVLERNDRIGEKIRISGGGRCNFTNTGTGPENFVSVNPHFATSALARYTPEDFISLLTRHRVGFHEKKPGQLFCDRGSHEVIAVLESEARAAGVRILTGCDITGVEKNDTFRVSTSAGFYHSASLVIATGGLSVPKIGATDLGYRVAGRFGLKVIDTAPALVPFTLSEEDRAWTTGLSGISVDAEVVIGKVSFRENILFTHRGLSGPAILQISSYWSPGTAVAVDLSPGKNIPLLFEEHRNSHMDISTVLSAVLPKRFVKAWCDLQDLGGPMSGFSGRRLRQIAAGLHRWEIVPEGTEGFAKAEVTRGGVDTGDLSSKTMEAKKVPGLYMIGEVVDVTGQLGGYNLQWAWASGFVAGQYA
ncbi:MAG TPA: NAD(P)/FAD-dependent oxidoreductase [Bacteroidota bacterium]|nr:NAD(P)/FAD-dependent oxidoreductase [Bacteroidota bacterium]